jgi:hypothetical protein
MGSQSTRTCGTEAERTSKMMPSMAMFAGLAAIVGGLWPDDAKPAAKAGRNVASLCMPNEVIVASCPIRRKLVSVCGRNGIATYRFGRPGRLEVSANAMHHTHQMFSGGGESQIVVTAGVYQYVLYDNSIRTGFGRDGHNDPAFKSGLMVLRNGRRLANMVCAPRGGEIIDTDSAPRFMPAGDYVWHGF